MYRSFQNLAGFSAIMLLISAFAAQAAEAADRFMMKRLERSGSTKNNGVLRPFIIGGNKADRARFSATVILSGVDYCTATIVGERSALTAAHCVKNGGSGAIDLGDGSALISATCTHHPEYLPPSDDCDTLSSACTADVALCLFNSSLTTNGLKYEVIQTDRTKIKADTSMVLLGYGCTSAGQNDHGTLYWGSAGIRSVSTDPPGNPNEALMIVDGGAILCDGDSGSGGFDQDDPSTRFVIGVGVRNNLTNKVSRFVQTSDGRIKTWMKDWGDTNNTSICGIHSSATGCR
jgi:hypothetical protein